MERLAEQRTRLDKILDWGGAQGPLKTNKGEAASRGWKSSVKEAGGDPHVREASKPMERTAGVLLALTCLKMVGVPRDISC